MRRLGALVVGDEILAGHTQESNTHWMAERLKEHGIHLARVEICSDDVRDIEASVHRFLHDLELDYVITSGGLGPTHDDRTMEGIARALGKELVLEPGNEQWMRERVKEGHRRGYFQEEEPNAGIMKMAYLPEGAEAMPNELGTCLGAVVEVGGTTLFTLPGVPGEFERMFTESVLPRLEPGEPDHVEEVVLWTEESRFYELLRDLEDDHLDVNIGSYPQPGYIVVRATGPEEDAKKAIAKVRKAGAEYLQRPSG